MDNPFDMVVYDKDLTFTGFVADPIYCNFVPSWQNQGYGSFMLAADNPHSAALQAKGARVSVNYRGRHLMSGPIRSYQGDVVKNSAVTYQLLDDRRLLVNTLLWGNPSHTLEASSLSDLGQSWLRDGETQTVGTIVHQDSYFRWPDGVNVTSTEGAIKWLIEANLINRLGRNVTIAPDLGRGGDPHDVLPKVRFVPLDEALTPLVKFSNMAVTMQQHRMSSTITADVVQPGEWEQPLTLESGIIASGTYSVRAPDITRPIIGGPGETAARVFEGIEGSGNVTALEVAYNDVIEVFRDASGVELNWPEGLEDVFRVAKYYKFQAASNDVASFVAAMGNEKTNALAAGPATTGLSLQLSESETFHFGGDDGVQLGDRVTVDINGARFIDQVTECQITFTRDKGLVVTPLVGESTDGPDVALAKAVASIAKALRTLSTSK